MTEIERITEQMVRAFHGNAWHGPSLMELLADVSAEQARNKPISEAHSIGELVLHATAWIRGAASMLRGNEVHLTGQEDWPAAAGIVNEVCWEKTLQDLEKAHGQLLELVSRLNDGQLGDPIAGRTYTVYMLLHGVVQHNLYHAGQLALLKRAI